MTPPDWRQTLLQLNIKLASADMMLLLALLLFAVGAALWGKVALNVYGDHRETELLEKQIQQRARVTKSDVGQGSAAERNLKAFYGALGARPEVERSIAVLFALAKEEGIPLEQGEYRWQIDSTLKTYRYQMLFPVKAPYAVIRRYCEKVLAELPFVSLDELTFKRASAGDDDIEATLRFSLFLKDAPPKPQLEVKSE